MHLIGRQLEIVLFELRALSQKVNQIMASQDDIKAAEDRIDAATAAIAQELKDLSAQLANAQGGLTADAAAAIAQRLATQAAALEALEPAPATPPAPPATA